MNCFTRRLNDPKVVQNHVKAEGGCHCDGLCGAGYIFDMRFETGKVDREEGTKEMDILMPIGIRF
jgi:hypothetical protein